MWVSFILSLVFKSFKMALHFHWHSLYLDLLGYDSLFGELVALPYLFLASSWLVIRIPVIVASLMV